MRLPVTHRLRRARIFFKTTAVVVIVTFLGLFLQPLAIAAHIPKHKSASTVTKESTDEEQLANTLEKIEKKLERLEAKLAKAQDASLEKSDLKKLHKQLIALDKKAMANFKSIEERLEARNIPAIILERHRKAVTTYRTEVKTLLANLRGIESAKNDTNRKIRAEKAKLHLQKKQRKRKPINPNKLPTRGAKPNGTNKPKTRTREFHGAGLFNTPTVKLVALGDFKFDKLPGAANPAFLAATPEVVLSAAIEAKATELEHDPVKIFNWVHDNTEWLPTWGAIQNSDTTLLTQKGNAFDLASLLVALLRASGIPARYVHGTIDVPVNKFMNWAGGFTAPEGAQDLASAGGIPISAVTSGGSIVAFRIEHVWVEAAIDFHPSRGVINKSADTWVALDPSFKQHIQEQGLDLHALLGFNGEEHFDEYLRAGNDETPYQFYSGKVLDFLNANRPDWSLEDLYGHDRITSLKPVIDGDLRLFASSLPYKLVVRGYTAAEIPDSLRHKVTIEIRNNIAFGSDISFTASLSVLGGDRLTLSYIPASAADDSVVDDYGNLFATPAYLVRVKPVLRQDDTVVAAGSAVGLGEKQSLAIQLRAPTRTSGPVQNTITVGSYSSIVIQGLDSTESVPSVNMEQLRLNSELNEQGQATLDNTFGQLLHSIGVLWFFDIKYERDFYASTTHVAYTHLPSEAVVTADLIVSFFFGIPRTVNRGLYTIDADTDVMAAASIENDTTRTKDFLLLAGLTGSAWEHLELEGAFDGPAVSAVRLIKTAAQQGIQIHKIDSSNVSTILPLLSLGSEDINDILAAVNAGRQVTVPQSEVQVNNYRGAGLIIVDPIRGDGLYLIGGGLAGGSACGTSNDPLKPCSKDEWERLVSDRPQVATLARQMIIAWAISLFTTPYGWGCKDPTRPANAYCAANNPRSRQLGIDCSGLVAWAYERVGYSHLKRKNAAGQHAAMDSYPSRTEAKAGDLIFFSNTYEKSDPPNGPGDDQFTHVGIVLNPENEPIPWIAAQKSRGVDVYTFSGPCPNVYPKECIDEPDFDSFGSVIRN